MSPTPHHSHAAHSHCFLGSHFNFSHNPEFMPAPLPCVVFHDEPRHIREQIALLGGSTIRHDFGPRCYNPGLAVNRMTQAYLASDFLMTFRAQEISEKIVVSNLSLAGVMADGTAKWTAPLTLPNIEGVEGAPMHEDGRLFWYEHNLFLAYSNVRLRDNGVTFKQSLVQLTPSYAPNMSAHVFKPEFTSGPLKHLNFGKNHALAQGHEKNWQFFDDMGDLAFVYSVHPHVVIHAATGRHFQTLSQGADDWTRSWGEMHGGTPPVRLPDGRYLSFFNSFIGHSEHQRRYVIGAYMFDPARNNYRVSHIIDKPLIVGSEREGFLWESPVYWEPIVAFATGAVYDDSTNSIRLSYGINDCFSETATFPLDKLLSRMVRV